MNSKIFFFGIIFLIFCSGGCQEEERVLPDFYVTQHAEGTMNGQEFLAYVPTIRSCGRRSSNDPSKSFEEIHLALPENECDIQLNSRYYFKDNVNSYFSSDSTNYSYYNPNYCSFYTRGPIEDNYLVITEIIPNESGQWGYVFGFIKAHLINSCSDTSLYPEQTPDSLIFDLEFSGFIDLWE